MWIFTWLSIELTLNVNEWMQIYMSHWDVVRYNRVIINVIIKGFWIFYVTIGPSLTFPSYLYIFKYAQDAIGFNAPLFGTYCLFIFVAWPFCLRLFPYWSGLFILAWPGSDWVWIWWWHYASGAIVVEWMNEWTKLKYQATSDQAIASWTVWQILVNWFYLHISMHMLPNMFILVLWHFKGMKISDRTYASLMQIATDVQYKVRAYISLIRYYILLCTGYAVHWYSCFQVSCSLA